MNEEEKEAIKFLKALKELQIVLTCSFWNKGEFKFNTLQKEQFDIILNLISKLQKESEQEKEKNKKLKKQSEISAKTHTKNDDLKDKVIDKMAKTIAGLQLYDFGRKEYFTLENEDEVIEYFYKKVEEENE